MVMIGYLVRGRVRIKIMIRVRVGVTFNVMVYHRSNCRRSKYCTFPSGPRSMGPLVAGSQALCFLGGKVEQIQIQVQFKFTHRFDWEHDAECAGRYPIERSAWAWAERKFRCRCPSQPHNRRRIRVGCEIMVRRPGARRPNCHIFIRQRDRQLQFQQCRRPIGEPCLHLT